MTKEATFAARSDARFYRALSQGELIKKCPHCKKIPHIETNLCEHKFYLVCCSLMSASTLNKRTHSRRELIQHWNKQIDNEIISCGFCDHTIIPGVWEYEIAPYKGLWYVRCNHTDCYAHGPVGSTPNEAISIWNKVMSISKDYNEESKYSPGMWTSAREGDLLCPQSSTLMDKYRKEVKEEK